MPRSFFPLLLGLVLNGLACDVYQPSMLLPGKDAGAAPHAYGQGFGWWSGTDPQTRCLSASVPGQQDRPANDPGPSIAPRMFGIRVMSFGTRAEDGSPDWGAWQDLGFDLDNTCTFSPTCPSVEATVSCKNAESSIVPADGKFCRDNTFARLLSFMLWSGEADLVRRFGLNDDTFNCSICQGAYNMLFRISEYNGMQNDASVRVDMYPSTGLPALKPIDCSQSTWSTDRCWTQDDIWLLQSEYVPSGAPGPNPGESRLYDPAAYVRDGIIVAALPPNSLLWFPGDRAVATAFPIVLYGGLVTAKLVHNDDGSWAIVDGVVAGRMKVTDALASFRRIGLCEDDLVYSHVSTFAHTWADILSREAVVPETPCDAVSMAIEFQAEEATAGALQGSPMPNRCENRDAGASESGSDAADAGAPLDQ